MLYAAVVNQNVYPPATSRMFNMLYCCFFLQTAAGSNDSVKNLRRVPWGEACVEQDWGLRFSVRLKPKNRLLEKVHITYMTFIFKRRGHPRSSIMKKVIYTLLIILIVVTGSPVNIIYAAESNTVENVTETTETTTTQEETHQEDDVLIFISYLIVILSAVFGCLIALGFWYIFGR